MGGGDLVYYEELAHAIMKTEKFQELLSISWSLGKASVVVQSKLKSLRARGIAGVSSSPSPKAQEQEG